MESRITVAKARMTLPDELPIDLVMKPTKSAVVRGLAERSISKNVAVRLPPDIPPKTARNILWNYKLNQKKVFVRKYKKAYYIVPTQNTGVKVRSH
ncbi:MAG: hypothetical protein QXF97_06475 [Candidatus Caldarchaeum sp.]